MTAASGRISHAPEGYVCPFCGLVAGDTSDPRNRCEPEDTVYQDEDVIVLIAADGFGDHEGHAMVCPAEHYENLYDLPSRVLQRIALTAKQVALSMKEAWAPDGVSTRQHNEPAGSQHVWHYHQHVLPRWHDDGFYFTPKRPVVDPGIRARKVLELKAFL